MSQYAIQGAGPGVFNITGELVFITVPSIVKETNRLFEDGNELVVDLSGVTRADSSALALLIEWMRKAEQQKQKLSFRNVPPKLLAIAQVSNLEDILPFA